MAAPPQAEDAGRWRSLLVWAGLVTLTLLSILALVHLLRDIGAVLDTRGGWSVRLPRLAPAAVLCVGALLLAVVVAWLAHASRHRERIAIAVGFIVLIALRVFLAAQLDGTTAGEPGFYRAMAESMLTPEWELENRPPGYALALAGMFALSDDRTLGTEALNLILALLAGGAVLALARGLYGSVAGALALLAYALWPAGALITLVSIPQTAFDLATVAGAWAAVGTQQGWRGHVLTGAILGLAQYLRPTAPAMLPAFVLARLWHGGSRRALAGAVAIPVITFLVVLSPIMAANLINTGSLGLSTSDYGGQSLYFGTHEPSGGRFDGDALEALIAVAGTRDVTARAAAGAKIALERIREDPLGIAALGIRKQVVLWGTEHYGVQYAIRGRLRERPEQPRATAPLLLSQGFYVLVLVTATLGVWLRRRHPDALVALAVTLIWTVAVIHALLEVHDRYHSYVIPVLLPLSALALATAFRALTTRVRPPSGPVGPDP